jgi:hypothetical protein
MLRPNLAGRQPAQVMLAGFTEPLPVEWDSQHCPLRSARHSKAISALLDIAARVEPALESTEVPHVGVTHFF